MSIEIPVFDSFNANNVNLNQHFLQWLGRTGNCNILAQQRAMGFMGIEVRFYCSVCGADKPVPRGEAHRLTSGFIKEFAENHRHIMSIPVGGADSRYFREDD